MRNVKKHLRFVFYSTMFFLVCFQAAAAQPTCGANFSPSDTCSWEIQNKEFVFLGRVVSIEKSSNGFPHGNPSKIVVEIETSLKGNLGAPRTELFLDRHCYGEVYENKRYIFTAGRVDNEKISGLFSEKWSSALGDDYSENDVKEILDEIRSVVRKVKQPRLVGSVVEQLSGARGGRFLIASNEVKTRFAPDYLRPMANVIVTAKRSDGREFKTETDANGGFVFGGLPLGAYEFYTNLPKEFDIVAGGNSITQEKDRKISLEIREYACSQRIIFNARLEGSIRIRFDNALSRWSHIILHLWRVRMRDGKREMDEFAYERATEKFLATENSGDIGFNHLFKNVPVGQYVLMLSITTDPSVGSKTVYYPGTFETEKAEAITVEAGKTANVEFSIPDLPEN